MTQKSDGFYFNVKQWLGDDAVILMDWDVRAMHLQLMCIAWQQSVPGVLPGEEALLRRWIGGVAESDWSERIRPQLLRAWRRDDEHWIQDGLKREFEKQASKSDKRRAAAMARWGDRSESAVGELLPQPEDPPVEPLISVADTFSIRDGLVESGFLLSKVAAESVDFLDKASAEERASIWTMGVQLLSHAEFTEDKARAYLGRLIQANGEKAVAESIAQLAIKAISPADAKSYLAGILKGEKQKKRGRGKVAL